ncbi:MAG: outer membrane beta-barrel protein [Bacteroidetes bacterium]|nr:outer membrane beta-barrel protein [Bacteroidota bacterium]
MSVLIVFTSTVPTIVYAQDEGMSSSDMASPIDPRFSYKPRFVGAIVGLGPSNQSGSFLTDKCDCPAFTDGTGINVIVGGLFEQLLTKNMVLGASVLYNYRSLTAEYTERESVSLQKEGSSDISKIAIPFLHTTKSSFTYITVQPYLKYYLIKNFFVRVSPALSFNIGSSLRHEKDMLQTTAKLPDGETVNISFPADKDARIVSDTKAIIQDTQFPKMTSFVLSADMALGIEIKAGKRMSIAPVLQYSLPFMDVSTSGTAFRLPSFLFCVEVKYNLDLK